MLYCPSYFLLRNCYVLCTPAISPHNSHIAQLRCAFMLYCPLCFLLRNCYVLCTPAISPHNSHIAQLRCAFMLYCPSCFLLRNCYVLCTPAISPHNSHIAQLRCAFMLIMRACPQNISVLLCKHKYAYVLVHCNKKRTLWEVLVYHKIRFLFICNYYFMNLADT